ncbi:MAG: tRNA (adenosine(37)-N6)-dimethylallyltransferase MiaA [Cyclobacteriaceae bacterium]
MLEKKLIVVAGPTAVGKTSVSLQLALHFKAPVVSADSRQVYREMTIGTAKPSPAERAAVPHYFIDTHSVGDDYDAAQYASDALKVIGDLFLLGDSVILCGGSGLYIKGICEGFDDMPEVPDEIRRDLIKNYHRQGIGWLHDRMQQLDPEGLQTMDPKNPHRLIRALEVKLYSGKSIASFRKSEKRQHNFNIIKIGLELPRTELYERIDERMDQMIARGLFEEARSLYPMRHHNALQTVGYQEIFGFIDNQYDLDECIRLLKRNSRRYAKRQLTWFKKDAEFAWFNPRDLNGVIDYIEGK